MEKLVLQRYLAIPKCILAHGFFSEELSHIFSATFFNGAATRQWIAKLMPSLGLSALFQWHTNCNAQN